MSWHIITGDFPPKRGGVSDYTYRLAEGFARRGCEVHIWAPGTQSRIELSSGMHLHSLPPGFGLRWLQALERGLSAYPQEDPVLVQYVPHMYGWKSMNVPFCWWVGSLRRKVLVMFHEVAFPFRAGQPIKHNLLAIVHRLMARIVLSGVNRSFTSIEPYQRLLHRLSPKARPEILRIFSNVPFRKMPSLSGHQARDSHFVVGVFSNFNPDISQLLVTALPVILENPIFHVRLVGPGENLVVEFGRRFPQVRDRVSTTGHLDVTSVDSRLKDCDALLQLYSDGACGARGTFIAALASGVPVVSTPGHLTEIIFKRSGAIAFCDPDPIAIRGTLEILQADPSYARKIGDTARQLYADEFSIDVTLERLHAAAGLFPPGGSQASFSQAAVPSTQQYSR